jgi:glutamate/tyrosine decarboxylase-like PLP-dependent enzyme
MRDANETDALFSDVARRAGRYIDGLRTRRVAPDVSALKALATLDEPLPSGGCAPRDVIALLDGTGSPATVATAGPRYFGFVIGGSFPVATASNWLVTAWDQCAGLTAMSPVSSQIETITARWIAELLRLPADTAVGFVTGSTTAHITALLAARHALYLKAGWDVDRKGLVGAPPITVVATEDVHGSVVKALGVIGLGRDTVIPVPVDAQGRMQVSRVPPLGPATVLVAQAGNVNSGSFDDLTALADLAAAGDAWFHVDGAIGAWARVSPMYEHLVHGLERADSMTTSAHKLLNVPYDSALVTCRRPRMIEDALSMRTVYAVDSQEREPNHFTLEGSRRARGTDIWAVLKCLGSGGLRAHIETCCANARRFAEALAQGGIRILNDVVFNQVLFDLGQAEERDRTLSLIRAEGTCWVGPTVWRGAAACRASFCGWSTTLEDAERSAEAVLRVRNAVASGIS